MPRDCGGNPPDDDPAMADGEHARQSALLNEYEPADAGMAVDLMLRSPAANVLGLRLAG